MLIIMPQTQQSNKTLGKFSKELARLADRTTFYKAIALKHITDWKAALGQILIYSTFHPERQVASLQIKNYQFKKPVFPARILHFEFKKGQRYC